MMGIVYEGIVHITDVRQLKPGDHVRIVKSVYDHHFVVLEVLEDSYLTVVDYNNKEIFDCFLHCPEACLIFNNFLVMFFSYFKIGYLLVAKIRKHKLLVDTVYDTVQVLKYSPRETVFSMEEIIKRANAEVGKAGYNMFYNNCESIINWIIIGKKVSNQSAQAAKVGLILLAVLVLLVGIIFAIIL